MFQIPSWPLEAFSEHRTWGDKMQTFPLHFWRRSTFTGRISSRHRFTQPRNQCKSFRKKIRPSSAFLHDDLRATWQKNKQTIKQTKNKQTNKQKDIKGPLNLQDTAYPFGDYCRRGCVRDGLCFLHNKSKYVRKTSACTVDPDVFGDDLKAQLFDFPASSNASAQADQLATRIGTVLNNHAPKRVVRPPAFSKPKPHPWLTDRLKYLFQQRTHLHRKIQQSNSCSRSIEQFGERAHSSIRNRNLSTAVLRQAVSR